MRKLLIQLFACLLSLHAYSQGMDENLKKGKSLYQYKEYSKALPYLQNAAKAGYGEAIYLCGNIYHYGMGTEKNPEIAMRMYLKAIEAGYQEGETEIGAMYESGEGVTIDLNKAVHYYQQSADHGNIWGRSRLADCYYYAKGVELNQEKAFKLYLESANQGHSYSALMVGYIYHTGNGAELNYNKARDWYNKSQEPAASYNIAWLAYEGKCSHDYNKQNINAAVSFMKSAAENGMGVEAEYLCGLWRDEQRILQKQNVDYVGDESIKWIRKAADKNHHAALKKLGDFYRDGLYVPMNKGLAKECYTKSAALGNKEAAEALKNL